LDERADIVCRNEDLLKKYDLKANDAILAEEKHMGLYEDLLKTDAKLIPGGAAQNTARGAAVSFALHHEHSMVRVHALTPMAHIVHSPRKVGRLHWLRWQG
jgi:hypothetical protein